MTNQGTKLPIRLEDLYPDQTPEWYAEAGANFDDYLSLIVQIYDRISADPEAYAQLREALAKDHSDGDRLPAVS